MPHWISAALERSAEPLINAGAALSIALIFGAILFLIFKGIGQWFLETVLIPFFKACDSVLVNRVAPLAGVTLKKTHQRWTALLATMLALVMTAALAPIPVALAAVLAGILLVLSIYRAWETDEKERQILEDNAQFSDKTDDLGNEILVGLLFLIVFFTLGFTRLSEQETIYRGEPMVPVASTAAYVWGEILKAVPIVDASEVYGFRNISGLEADGSFGRTLTFIFRVCLDLLLITALLRLVAIIRRRVSGQDLRDIRSLYTSPDEVKISEAIDRLAAFAMKGSLNAQNEIERIALREPDYPQLKTPMVLFKTGRVLQELSDKFGSMKFLLPAMEAHKGTLEVWTRETASTNWAMAQHNLGTTLSALGRITGDKERLEDAVAALRAALEIRVRDTIPADWAVTQNNLGTALWALGKITGDKERLEEAITAYRASLEVYTPETMPADWAMTQHNLGVALSARGEVLGDAEQLQEAVAAYRAALEVRTRSTMPAEWAMTQNNLGTALRTLGSVTRDTDRLEEAATACRAALEVCTRKTMPADWAMAQNNLGAALSAAGRIAGDTDRLEEAIVAYRAALEVYTRETMPTNWAITQTNLGTVLQAQGRIAGDARRLEEAILRWQDASEFYRESGIQTALRDKILSNIERTRQMIAGLQGN